MKQFDELKSGDDSSDEFSQWIFPHLVVHRRPLYQGIADTYGYTIDAAETAGISSETELLELIADTMAANG